MHVSLSLSVYTNLKKKIVILSLGCSFNNQPDWFTTGVKLRMWNESIVNIWSNSWLCSEPLMHIFLRLYTMAGDKDYTVAEASAGLVAFRAGNCHGTNLCSVGKRRLMQNCWNCWLVFTQIEGLRIRGSGSLMRLNDTLSGRDTFCSSNAQNAAIDNDLSKALRRIWSGDVPSKIEAFMWRLLIDRLPIRTALVQRGLLDQTKENSRVFCLTWQNFTAAVFWVFLLL